MTAVVPTQDPAARYRIEPTVLQALRSPRILTREVLAGLVVAIALIPEAIAFSIIAGVDPRVGLFSSFVMAVAIAFLGGRPAMITAATGAIALVIAPVAREYGMDYFIATVILGGLIQIVLALLGVAKLMRFIPRSVMVGFVNALAILIFISQIPQLLGVPWMVYPLVVAGLLIMYLMPLLTRVVPAPLVAIVLLTAAAVVFGISVPTVGDQGQLPQSLPELFIPNVPLTLDTLGIIFPFAAAMAIVGLLESLMTAKLVDDITDTHSRKTREAWAQGAANILSGAFDSSWVWFRFFWEDESCPVSSRRSSGNVRSGCWRRRCLSMRPSTPRFVMSARSLESDRRRCGNGVADPRSTRVPVLA